MVGGAVPAISSGTFFEAKFGQFSLLRQDADMTSRGVGEKVSFLNLCIW